MLKQSVTNTYLIYIFISLVLINNRSFRKVKVYTFKNQGAHMRFFQLYTFIHSHVVVLKIVNVLT